jgi:hypothetical protein
LHLRTQLQHFGLDDGLMDVRGRRLEIPEALVFFVILGVT